MEPQTNSGVVAAICFRKTRLVALLHNVTESRDMLAGRANMQKGCVSIPADKSVN